MAIPTEHEEDAQKKPTATRKPFSAALDPSDPLGFLEKSFEFVARESDLFKSDSLLNDVVAAVRMVKDKVETEDTKKKEGYGKSEKRVKGGVPPRRPAVRKEEAAAEGSRAPNKGNGLDMDNYSWGQTIQEVNITVPVPLGTNARSITCEMKRSHIKVGLMGQPPIIDGELYKPIKVDDCFWSLEDQKSISILLTKHDQKDWWKYVVKGEPEIDTRKVKPETTKLVDLDSDSRSSVERMMFDDRQKRMGKPTRGEMQKQELLKRFVSENPEMCRSSVKNN